MKKNIFFLGLAISIYGYPQTGCDSIAIRNIFQQQQHVTELTSCSKGCHFYFHDSLPRTAEEATVFANTLGAELASFHTSTENICVISQINNHNLNDSTWIGFSDILDENDFTWNDGEQVGFKNWDFAQPDNNNGDGHCTLAYPNGAWGDWDCHTTLAPSIIEVNLCPKTTIEASKLNICRGDSITLEATTILGSAPYKYRWSSNPVIMKDSGKAIIAKPTIPTAYTLTVTDRYGCESYAGIIIDVDPYPNSKMDFAIDCDTKEVQFSNQSTILFDTITSVAWNFGDGSAIDSNNITTHTYVNGDFEVALITGSSNGCLDTLIETIRLVKKPQALFDLNKDTVCIGESILITNNSMVQQDTIGRVYVWDFGTQNFSYAKHPVMMYDSAANYSIKLMAGEEGSCKDSMEKNVTVIPFPVADFTTDKTHGCPGVCINFIDNSIGNYPIESRTWIFFRDSINNGKLSANYCFDDFGKRNVELFIEDIYGCTAKNIKESLIEVWEPPISQFSVSPGGAYILDPFIKVIDNSIDAHSWLWKFGDGETSNLPSDEHTYYDVGLFEIQQIVSDSNGCVDSSSIEIEILPQHFIHLPNTFTPDGDGLNDIFVPKGLEVIYSAYSFGVYNRDGEQVFYTETIGEGWDGTSPNSDYEHPVGSYVYRVDLIDDLNNERMYTGVVNLIR